MCLVCILIFSHNKYHHRISHDYRSISKGKWLDEIFFLLKRNSIVCEGRLYPSDGLHLINTHICIEKSLSFHHLKNIYWKLGPIMVEEYLEISQKSENRPAIRWSHSTLGNISKGDQVGTWTEYLYHIYSTSIHNSVAAQRSRLITIQKTWCADMCPATERMKSYALQQNATGDLWI